MSGLFPWESYLSDLFKVNASLRFHGSHKNSLSLYKEHHIYARMTVTDAFIQWNWSLENGQWELHLDKTMKCSMTNKVDKLYMSSDLYNFAGTHFNNLHLYILNTFYSEDGKKLYWNLLVEVVLLNWQNLTSIKLHQRFWEWYNFTWL